MNSRRDAGPSSDFLLAYVSLFCLGLLELWLQWHIWFGSDPSATLGAYVTSLFFGAPLALVACGMALLKAADATLRTVALATVFVALLQVAYGAGALSGQAVDYLNGVDLAWGVFCLIAWPVGALGRDWKTSVLVLMALVAVSVLLRVA